jgi:hypothetical protein
VAVEIPHKDAVLATIFDREAYDELLALDARLHIVSRRRKPFVMIRVRGFQPMYLHRWLAGDPPGMHVHHEISQGRGWTLDNARLQIVTPGEHTRLHAVARREARQ